MPLVAYVADDFHRFITSDRVHGEQSFFDTCRSFGAFCVVASQSMSSLHHALGGDSYTNKAEKAVEILLNNTGTKLFFRTTDSAWRTLGRSAWAPSRTVRPLRCAAPAAPPRPPVYDQVSRRRAPSSPLRQGAFQHDQAGRSESAPGPACGRHRRRGGAWPGAAGGGFGEGATKVPTCEMPAPAACGTLT